jgi:SRSO17 transposase
MMTAQQVTRIRRQLQEFVESFAPELGRSERRHWCGKYLEGLLIEGERKSIEPMAARVSGGDEQAMQQFVNQSPWEHAAVMFRLRAQVFARREKTPGVLVLDDTSLPKQGRHSVGVARQYCGALGKVANCQSVVSWLWAGERVYWPVAAELYLPEAWTADPPRMARAGVPEDAQRFREKWRVALDLLAECKPQLPAYRAIVFDAGYGAILPLLEALEEKGEPYIAQIPAKIAMWPADVMVELQPKPNGRPQKHWRVRDTKLRPRRAQQWRELLQASPRRWKTVRLPRADGTYVRAIAVRVRGTERQAYNYRPGVERWLLIEQLSDDTFKYYFSNLPADTPLADLIVLAHQRWKVEQGYQQLKEELGLDHFEGRSWRGLHHHLTLCFLAYAFLNRLRLHAPKKTAHAA